MLPLQSYRQAWRKRWEDERMADAEAGRKALAIAEKLAKILKEQYRATKVILCGSLARGEFHVDSDIDLAVEGLAPEWFFQAGADLARIAKPLGVDLVPLESAQEAYRSSAISEGIVLYDAR